MTKCYDPIRILHLLAYIDSPAAMWRFVNQLDCPFRKPSYMDDYRDYVAMLVKTVLFDYSNSINNDNTLQEFIVRNWPWAINHIQNPCNTAQILSLKRQAWNVKEMFSCFKSPSEDVQLAAVEIDGSVIQYIQNPSEAVRLAAVRQSCSAIQYIQNPSKEVQLAAVQKNGWAIRYLNNPSESVKFAAVGQSSDAIHHIHDPSELLQLVAVRQDCFVIGKYQNPSEAAQLEAVRQNGEAIKNIENPSETVQIAALEQVYKAIFHIKNPSDNVKLEAMKQFSRAIGFSHVSINIITPLEKQSVIDPEMQKMAKNALTSKLEVKNQNSKLLGKIQ